MNNNKNHPKAKGIVVFIGTLFFMANASIDTLPNFDWEPQVANQTCWAACCQMVLDYYQHITNQEDIISYGTQGANSGNYIYQSASNGMWYGSDTTKVPTPIEVDTTICVDDYGDENYSEAYCEENPDECSCSATTVTHPIITLKITPTGPFYACNGILNYFGPVTSSWLNSDLTFIQVENQINAGYPIIAARSSSNAGLPDHVVVIRGYDPIAGTVFIDDPADRGL